jgi:hypothetical protein
MRSLPDTGYLFENRVPEWPPLSGRGRREIFVVLRLVRIGIGFLLSPVTLLMDILALRSVPARPFQMTRSIWQWSRGRHVSTSSHIGNGVESYAGESVRNLTKNLVMTIVIGVAIVWSAYKYAWPRWMWWPVVAAGILIVTNLILDIADLSKSSALRKAIREHDYRLCPSCRYSLVGLPSSGKCPECGVSYDIAQVQSEWRRWLEPTTSGGGIGRDR